MSRTRWWHTLVVAAALAGPVQAGAPATSGAPVLRFPGAAPARLKLDVSVNGVSPQASWNTFLDALFDFFDRNGDGVLSRAEAERIFPLPVAKGKPHRIDFNRLDVDHSGTVSRQEFRAYCLDHGFGPVVVFLEPPTAEDARLGAWWWGEFLGQKHGGQLTGREWQQMPVLIRPFDLNDDEYLDLTEIVAAAKSLGTVPRAPASSLVLAKEGKGAPVLRIDLGTEATVTLHPATAFPLAPPIVRAGLFHLSGAGGSWWVSFKATRVAPDFRSTREFLVAQMDAALGTAKSLSRAEIENDPTLSGLAGLFDYADRNGDNRLTLNEVSAYLDLLEKGTQAQLWIKVADRAHNPLPYLDANGDGRLSLHELTRFKLLGKKGLTGLPRQFQIQFTGPADMLWGGVRIPKKVTAPPSKADAVAPGPPWFVALDRNKDGYLSPREFPGPPALFQKLDTDHDGLISVEEARQAQGHQPKVGP
jgi:Ca2+-binding EF-hand superfamily protein